eukprot:COSAG02_NODE_6595_length_3471_cov_8.811981_5_plen_52_part_00
MGSFGIILYVDLRVLHVGLYVVPPAEPNSARLLILRRHNLSIIPHNFAIGA